LLLVGMRRVCHAALDGDLLIVERSKLSLSQIFRFLFVKCNANISSLVVFCVCFVSDKDYMRSHPRVASEIVLNLFRTIEAEGTCRLFVFCSLSLPFMPSQLQLTRFSSFVFFLSLGLSRTSCSETSGKKY
jgi:hypothetical protein